MSAPKCGSCDATPVLLVGLPVAVSFTDDGLGCTVSTDVAEIADFTTEDVSCCPTPKFTAEDHRWIRGALAQVADRYAPSLDCDLNDVVPE